MEQRKEELKFLRGLSKNEFEIHKKLRNSHKDTKSFINEIINSNLHYWDYGYGIELERMYLIRLRDSIQNSQAFIGWDRQVERMNTCIKLIDIIQGKKSAIKLINTAKIEFDENNHYLPPSEEKWKFVTKVNTRNYKRFFPIEEQSKLLTYKVGIASIYDEKAWCLYHKMRQYWLRQWWW